MAVPDDAEQVLWALRFGWYVAETRGRSVPGRALPTQPVRRANEPYKTLPLRIEQDAQGLRLEAQTVVRALAAKLDDTDRPHLAALANAVDATANSLAESPPAATWRQLADAIWQLDAATQDLLTGRSDTQACAYQLGRGLAECYWALDCQDLVEAPPPPPKHPDRPPKAPKSPPRSYWFVLGEQRRNELSRLIGRLGEYFHPLTAPAVAGTLAVWHTVAGDPKWRKTSGIDDELYRQIRRWYELLVLGQDPTALIRAAALLRSPRATWTVLRGLAGPLVLAVAGIVTLSYFATFLAAGRHSGFTQVLTGSLGAVGLTLASIQAQVKSSAQKLVSRARDDAYTDLVAVQILTVTVPRRRKLDPRRAGTVRDRKLTAASTD